MAITWRFEAEDVAGIRFAFSPLWELVSSLRTLRDPARQAVHLPWIKAVRPQLRELDLSELFALVPVTGYLPDFLTPPPETPLPDFAAEWERLRATPPATAADEVGRVEPDPGLDRFLSDPAAGIDRVAEVLARYWRTCFAEYWPRVHGLLERDVLRRSRRLVNGGARELFASLDPSVVWDGGRLTIDKPWCSATEPYGDGLVLTPTAFHWPSVAVMSPPYQPMLMYPVEGIATLWEQGPPPAPDALAALIGRRRAEILLAIGEPTTTSALARRMSVTTGAVSQHLGVLAGGGLATASRAGKEVFYRRTPVGDSLAAG